MSSFIWLPLCALLCISRCTQTTPIVGGQFVKRQQQGLVAAKYPHMVSLQDRLIAGATSATLDNETAAANVEYRHFCGGSLLSASYILTAAHCVWRKNLVDSVVAVIGIEDLSTVTETERHAISRTEYINFQPASYQNDIALLQLALPFQQQQQQPQPQPPANMYAQLPRPGMKVNRRNACRIIGYGATHYGGNVQSQLSEGEVHVITNRQCRKVLGMFAPRAHEHTVCALGQNQDTCQGDSGGPLLCRYAGIDYVTGIVSHGPTCGISGAPSLYTVVMPLIDWIQATLRGV